MSAEDVGRVMEIAGSLPHAPHWPASAYVAAMNPENTPRRIALVAEEGGTAAGFVVANVVAAEAELEAVVVAAEAQRRGLGGMLLDALQVELRAEQATDLILEVRASNRAALGLYGTHGFVEFARRVRYYADPEEDAVLMWMRLV
jgi:ribosomal-protein-alanine N-acetyltransferase